MWTPTGVEVVWILEHRQMEDHSQYLHLQRAEAKLDKRDDKLLPDCMQTVIIYTASTREKAEEYIRKPHGKPETQGWYVIFPELVDNDGIYVPENVVEDSEQHVSFYIYDLAGNPLESQPV